MNKIIPEHSQIVGSSVEIFVPHLGDLYKLYENNLVKVCILYQIFITIRCVKYINYKYIHINGVFEYYLNKS